MPGVTCPSCGHENTIGSRFCSSCGISLGPEQDTTTISFEAGESAGNASPTSGGYTAAALFHLGRRVEARRSLEQFFSTIRERWVGSGRADAAAIARWFLYLFPIANPQEWMQLRDGIRGAGGPTDGLRHHDW